MWFPYLAGLIDSIEGVQISFIKKLKGIGQLSYTDRLKTQKIERLEFRRMEADLILYFKNFHDLIDIDSKT